MERTTVGQESVRSGHSPRLRRLAMRSISVSNHKDFVQQGTMMKLSDSASSPSVEEASSQLIRHLEEAQRNRNNSTVTSQEIEVVFADLHKLACAVDPWLGSTVMTLTGWLSMVTFEENGTGTGTATFGLRVGEMECALRKHNDDAKEWLERRDTISEKLELLVKILGQARLEELAWHDRVDRLKQKVIELHTDKLNYRSEQSYLLEGTAPLHAELEQLVHKLQALEVDIEKQKEIVQRVTSEKKSLSFQLAALKVKSTLQLGKCEVLVPVSQLVECEDLLEKVNTQIRSFELSRQQLLKHIQVKEQRLEHLKRSRTQILLGCQQLKSTLAKKRFASHRASTPRPNWNRIFNDRLPCLRQRLVEYSQLKSEIKSMDSVQDNATNASPVSGLTSTLVDEIFKVISTRDPAEHEKQADPLTLELSRGAKLSAALQVKEAKLASYSRESTCYKSNSTSSLDSER